MTNEPDNTLSNKWEVEYEQLSEDFRQYVSDGWQVPLAALAVDGLVVGAAWTLPNQYASGFVLLIAGLMTLFLGLQVLKWDLRTGGRISALKKYDKNPNNKFSRFASDENWFLSLRIGFAFVAVTLLLAAGILIFSYLFFTGSPLVQVPPKA